MIRIVLGEREFKDLVSGKVVSQDNVEIILADIGYVRMLYIIKWVAAPRKFEKGISQKVSSLLKQKNSSQGG